MLCEEEVKLREWESYETYRKSQIETHDRKSKARWVELSELRMIASILTQFSLQGISKGICHGVRTGKEVSDLTELLGLDKGNVIGTDIAADPEGEIYQHDFHDERQEWCGMFDFVYTNALDHAHDPALALKVWASQLRTDGILLIHWSSAHNYYSEKRQFADCFAATACEVIQLIGEAGLEFIDDIKTVKKENERAERRILVARAQKRKT